MVDVQMLDNAVAEINALVKGATEEKPEVELPAELVLMQKAAAASVEAALLVFNEAKNALEETRAHAEKLCADAEERAVSLAKLRKRTEKFGNTTLDAFKEFHNGHE